jgi:hypothetical protein
LGTPRWLIGTIFIFILLTIIGNIIEYADVLTATQVAELQTMTNINISEAADPTVGGVLTYGGAPKNVIDAVMKAITMDFTWLYDIDRATSQASCAAGVLQGWKWNSALSACQKPNQYYWIWVLLWYPIMIALLFELAIMLARLIRGV